VGIRWDAGDKAREVGAENELGALPAVVAVAEAEDTKELGRPREVRVSSGDGVPGAHPPRRLRSRLAAAFAAKRVRWL